MDPAEAMERANIAGTKGALEFAEAVGAGCFHLVSSIAAAGLYRGTFTEDMFEEAEELDHPYHRTKHDSEAMVRERCAWVLVMLGPEAKEAAPALVKITTDPDKSVREIAARALGQVKGDASVTVTALIPLLKDMPFASSLCGSCSAVCPVPNCITMQDRTNGAPFESWNDRIAKGTAKVPGGLADYRAAHGAGTAGRGR